MPESTKRPLRVFLCHSSNDKPAVRELYQKLRAEAWIHPWLDEEELFPGQDWNLEIEKAVEASDAIIVCLSNNSITKEGYVQRELRIVLDYADYKPEGTLYIIPIRLEDCEPPRRLRVWQYADYFPKEGRERAFQRLLVSLRRRADSLGMQFESPEPKKVQASMPAKESKPERKPAKKEIVEKQKPMQVLSRRPVKPVELSNKIILSNGMEFMRVPAGKFLMGSKKDNKSAYSNEKPQLPVDIPYDYWMARFPVTNEQYNAYVKATGIKHPVSRWEGKRDYPVAYVKWTDAMAYCQWLNELLKGELPAGIILRLPTEAEWEKAARWLPSPSGGEAGGEGESLEYPWGNEFDIKKCNTSEGNRGDTTSVGSYSPSGDSPYGCADMAGNVWEWTHSLLEDYPYKATDGREDEQASGYRVLRGGSFNSNEWNARCACRNDSSIVNFSYGIGFRVVASPRLS